MGDAGGVLEISSAELAAGASAFERMAGLGALALRVRGALSVEACRAATSAVYAAREAWVADFDASQFSLGRAFYTHLEQGRARDYFEGAAAADASVERALPGMQARLRAFLASGVGAPVVARRGYCGPGVHVFPAGEWVAREGGEIHFDTEGLTPAQRYARAPAVTAVLMLQPPARGGELRVWDRLYVAGEDDDGDGDDDDDGDDAITDGVRFLDVPYAVGDLVMIDSYRLHQIRPFEGSRDRISVTAHAAKAFGEWQSWF